MARLSTHVLDTARGVPAPGVRVDLHFVRGEAREFLNSAITNADGRTDAPLLASGTIEPGTYELTFHAGDYLRQSGASLTDPPFLDQIVLRFGVADPRGNYHLPLLLSAHGYTTYRGS